MRGLTGRRAVVTGASRGIGLAVARRLVEEGARVTLTARHAEPLEQAVAALNDGHPEPVALAVPGNSGDRDHRAAAVAATVAAYGGVDVLVNNTGINPTFGPLLDLDLDAARKTVDVNVVAALGWVQECHRSGWGARQGAATAAVVNVASLAGVRPAPGISWYGATKAMLIHLTRDLALELGPEVRVNGVAPAVVKTAFASALYDGREAEVAAGYPLRRLGVPEDVAGAVAFLASDDASWMTGHTLVLDGGVSQRGGH